MEIHTHKLIANLYDRLSVGHNLIAFWLEGGQIEEARATEEKLSEVEAEIIELKAKIYI